MAHGTHRLPTHVLHLRADPDYNLRELESFNDITKPWHALLSQNIFQEQIDKWNVPAISLGIVDGDDVCAMSFGYSDVEKKVENTPSTLYYGASTTKAFTAAAFARLVEEKMDTAPLHWQTKLRDIAPGSFRLSDSELTDEVTVEDALSHCAGIASHENSLLVEYNTDEDNAESYLQKVGTLPVGNCSKGRLLYTNFMYVVMSVLLYVLTGRRLEQFLRETIWDRIGMNHTCFKLDHMSPNSKKLATGYSWSEACRSFKPLPKRDYSKMEGAGAIVSNVVDYARWIHCLIQQRGPISVAGHQALTTNRAMKSPKTRGWKGVTSQGYALGWSTLKYKGECIAYHTGTLPGFSSLVIFSVTLKWGIVAFSNADQRGLDVSNIICWGLLDELLGGPHDARQHWDRNMARKSRSRRKLKTVEMLFLILPERKTPMSMSQEMYLGGYIHPAYGIYYVMSQGTTFFIEALHLPCRSVFVFEHVDGDWFLVKQHKVDWDRIEILRAKFHVENRKVRKLGIAFEESMGEEMIWFVRD